VHPLHNQKRIIKKERADICSWIKFNFFWNKL
jgi:hypothetical protein